jgi:thioredoxin reductase (NADPH)
MQGMSEKQTADAIWDMVIVGGGPAGYTAGLYAARANLKVKLIKGVSTVSQITTTDLLENYPGILGGIGGFELVEIIRDKAESFGLSVADADCTALLAEERDGQRYWVVQAGEQSFRTLSVVMATGAHWRKLAVPGEELYTGRGVSYCATCDGPFFRNRDVIVVGGGDTAVQEALFLTKFASKVTLVHRRDRLRATAILQKRALAHEKISFVWNTLVEEISGAEAVTNVRLRDVRDENKSWEIPAAGVFVFIGLNPNSDLVKGHVALGDDDAILVDPQMRTSAKGIFACGDCTQKLLRQVVTACGDGATAAFSAQLYIEELKGVAY